MQVHNAVTPTAEQIEGFLAPDAARPIYMVNLLKFKAHAEYEDGRKIWNSVLAHKIFQWL